MTRTKSMAAQVASPDDVLAELLQECRDGVRTCFKMSKDQEYEDLRLEAMKVAARLTKASLALAAALNKTGADFTHRIIVERAVAAADPLPTMISGKTIHGVDTPPDTQD